MNTHPSHHTRTLWRHAKLSTLADTCGWGLVPDGAVVTEGNRHVASVHFSGMIREAAGTAAMPFNEVWNLAKPVSGDKGWVIAGIQQLA